MDGPQKVSKSAYFALALALAFALAASAFKGLNKASYKAYKVALSVC